MVGHPASANEKGRRRIWNVPRPIRTSRPSLYRSFLEVLFSDEKYSVLKDKSIQADFDKQLKKFNYKRNTSKPRDPNPGYVRTLINHLESLCLIFIQLL